MMGWRVGYVAYPEDGSGALASELLKVQDTIPVCGTQLRWAAPLCAALRFPMTCTLPGAAPHAALPHDLHAALARAEWRSGVPTAQSLADQSAALGPGRGAPSPVQPVRGPGRRGGGPRLGGAAGKLLGGARRGGGQVALG